MNVLGIDFETTGLDYEVDDVIEYGAVVWDIERSMPLKVMGDFVKTKEIIRPEITKLTGITPLDVDRYGILMDEILAELSMVVDRFDIKMFVAHNAVFDRTFFERYVKDVDMFKGMLDIRWLCTKKDIPYPDDLGRGDLLTMAAKHGFLNPFSHRGCTDALTALKIMGEYSWLEIMKFRESPMMKVISLAPYDQKDEVREQGFYWNPNTKKWTRELRAIVFEREKEKWNFRYRVEK